MRLRVSCHAPPKGTVDPIAKTGSSAGRWRAAMALNSILSLNFCEAFKRMVFFDDS